MKARKSRSLSGAIAFCGARMNRCLRRSWLPTKALALMARIFEVKRWTVGAALALIACHAPAAPADLLGRPPNVVFILSDDQRPDTIGALGNKQINTPHLDRLVQSGFTATHTFCMGSTVGAVCITRRCRCRVLIRPAVMTRTANISPTDS